MKNKLIPKLIFYFGGLIIMSIGVVLSIKSNLGVTPVSSIPYTMTLVVGMDLGLATTLFSVVVVLLQILLLRKNYKLFNLLQIPIGIVFGSFLSACGKLMAGIPAPESFVARIILMLISTAIVAVGVFMYVSPGLIPLAPEGFMLTVTQLTKKNFATIKIIFDVSMVLISLTTCLVMTRSFGSVGIGTVVAAVVVGIQVKWLNRWFGAKRDQILGLNK